MKFNFDQEADALSIELSDSPIARTEQIDEGTLVDVDRFGAVVAIEVLRPARRWPLDQILETFAIADEDARMLSELWTSHDVYPFGSSAAAPLVAS